MSTYAKSPIQLRVGHIVVRLQRHVRWHYFPSSDQKILTYGTVFWINPAAGMVFVVWDDPDECPTISCDDFNKWDSTLGVVLKETVHPAVAESSTDPASVL